MADLTPLPLDVRPLDAPEVLALDHIALIFSIGYETRATHVARKYKGDGQLIGFTFDNHRVGAFSENLDWARRKAKIIDIPEDQYRQGVVDSILPLIAAHETLGIALTPRVLVDISSMTRQRIADTFLALHRDIEPEIEVNWVYVPATFPGAAPAGDGVVTNGPVVGFEGWGDPTTPATCVVGAGFEGDLALGVIDDLEPQELWAFVPKGYSEEHDVEIDERNAAILEAAEPNVLSYSLDQPFETLLTLDSLLRGMVPASRVVLLPLGPKVFALLCVIVSSTSPRDITVWRVSAEQERVPRDRVATGSIIGLKVSRPSNSLVQPMG